MLFISKVPIMILYTTEQDLSTPFFRFFSLKCKKGSCISAVPSLSKKFEIGQKKCRGGACPFLPLSTAIPCFAQNVLCIVLYRKPACAKPFAAVWGEWANVRVCPSRKTALEYGRGKPLPYGEIRNSTKNMVYQQTEDSRISAVPCLRHSIPSTL